MTTKEYSVDDVEALARTIVQYWEDHNSDGMYRCQFCAGYHGSKYPTKNFEGFAHSVDCPVFIARDVMT